MTEVFKDEGFWKEEYVEPYILINAFMGLFIGYVI
jgi:hypothetical protein